MSVVEAKTIAARLGVSEEAVAAIQQTPAVDLHIDTFIPVRLWGYDVEKRHGLGVLRGRFGGHLDLPRMRDAGIDGAMWSVTTNPVRTAEGRWKTALKNFARMRKMVETSESMVIASDYQSYMAATAAGQHVVMPVIQGGNALDAAPDDNPLPDPDLLRVTLVHLTNSAVGQSSNPSQLNYQSGLTDLGRDLVRKLNQHKVFVDLAHISKSGFWQALEVHDKSQPVLVTHTGVETVKPMWRNIDDAQIRAVAETGGTIGVIFASMFLRGEGMRKDASMVIDHMQHIIDVVGDDFVSLGSDYDGAITPPSDLRSGDSYPRLVQLMLDRGWSTSRVEKVLGLNYLRALKSLRG